MSELQYLTVSDFALQTGTTMPSVSLAYRTLGTLNDAKDNAIVVTTGFSGTDTVTEAALIGKDRALDPTKYFIILPNLLGSGRSSSPSNTPEPFERARFPLVTVFDNVSLQHRLVEKLGIEQLRMVAGWSMGAAQSFQWAAQYPDMVKAICPIAGAARAAEYNKVFLYSLERVLRLDPAFRDGYYVHQPINGLKAFASIYAGWGFSEPAYRNGLYRSLGAADYKEWIERFWEPSFIHCDANNLLSQLWTWVHADISANSIYKGNFEAALAAIKARAIVLPVDLDRYFPPVDSEYEVKHMRNAQCRVIRSDWGHYMPANPGERHLIDGAIEELLTDEEDPDFLWPQRRERRGGAEQGDGGPLRRVSEPRRSSPQ